MSSLCYKMIGWNGVPKTTQGPYFICDNGYMEWKKLICGFQGPLASVEEKVFTSVVGSTRHIIENVFSHLKKRWRMLDYGLRYRDVSYCHKVFITCCVLHNIMCNFNGTGSTNRNLLTVCLGAAPSERTLRGNQLEKRNSLSYAQCKYSLMTNMLYMYQSGVISTDDDD